MILAGTLHRRREGNSLDMMMKRPISVTVALILILLNALIWIAFGIIVAIDAHPAIPDHVIVRWTMAILAMVCSIALAVLVFFLARRNKIAFYLATALLAVIAILTFTDDVGISDLIFLLFTIATLILLVSGRRWYLQPS